MTTEFDNEHNAHNAQRARYMKNELGHDEFYCWLADQIGVTIEDLTITTDRILRSADPHFNDIPLSRWDDNHYRIMSAARNRGRSSWSMSDSVCIAKAIARRWLNTRQLVDANRQVG